MGEETINKFNSKEKRKEVNLDVIDERTAAILVE
jgi:hypothetical protein